MRRAISVVTIVFLVMVSFGVLMNFDITTQNATAVDSRSGSITKDDTWSGVMYIAGDVTITNGARVTISAGTTVIFNSTTYSITVDTSSSLDAKGDTQQGDVTFKIHSGRWDTIIVQDTGYANFTHCNFQSSNNGISLSGNNYRTYIANCSFNDTGNYYFSLTNSQINVISTEFEGNPFDATANMSTNRNRIDLTDDLSELFIEYFIEVETRDGSNSPISGVTVDVQPSGVGKASDQYLGTTDATGRFSIGRAPALRINGTSPNEVVNFNYNTTVEVYDKWDGSAKEEVGISRQKDTIINATNEKNNNTLKLENTFIFNYPPRIDTSLSKVVVKEDKQQTAIFKFHDNDDLTSDMVQDPTIPNKFDGVTIYIKDQLGVDIYDTGSGAGSTKTNWVKWSNGTGSGSGPELIFYRTIESPFTTAGADDYRQKVTETINITVQDELGNTNYTEFQVEFHNVPDKPAIDIATTTHVTEDRIKYIPISISDDDNSTNDIEIASDTPYVSYQKSNSTLKLLFPNEFGGEGQQQLVKINATDNCYGYDDTNKLVKNVVAQSFNVIFHQTPDPPVINGTIPDIVGNESGWISALDLKDYWSDPDPDQDSDDLSWFVTGVNTNIFEVSGENVTATTPLVFNLVPNLELGGADNPVTIEDDVTIWLEDKDGLRDSQSIKLKLSSTNLQPSLHKIEKSITERITVDPEEGNTEIYFKFMIEYKDSDGEFGDKPDYVKVVIDNTSYDMIESNEKDTNYKDGKNYHYETKLTEGIHEHYFICSDGLIEARHPEAPNVINLPDVESKIYIEEFVSADGNIIARIGYSGGDGDATISMAADPSVSHDKDKGDMGEFFKIITKDISSIDFIDFTIKFGDNYQNYGSKWLRKDDMQLAYLKDNKWVPVIIGTSINKNKQTLKCNLTPEPTYEYDVLLDDIIKGSAPQIFTVIGWLDADGDGYFNDEDAFPFDPAARYDRDGDGSPGDTEWVPGKSAKDSTSSPKLHVDKFPDDPAASVNDDGDECPDEWNPGQSAENSTTNLTLDMFPDNADACMDTDGDNQPDGDTYNTKEWMDRDDDDDGMPDHWENNKNDYALEKGYTKRFNTKDASDASQDWDGDGRDNLQEYKDNTNPFEKDSTDEDVLGNETTIIILAVIIIVVVLIAVFGIISKRRKDKSEEDMPRGMGGSEQGPEQAPGPEETAPPPEGDIAPPVPPVEEPVYDEGTEYQEQETTYADQDQAATDEYASELADEVESENEAEIETELPEETPEMDQPEQQVPEAEITDGTEMETELEGQATTTTEESTETTESELQYTCPNCNTPVTPDMAACPGCQTPLTFE